MQQLFLDFFFFLIYAIRRPFSPPKPPANNALRKKTSCPHKSGTNLMPPSAKQCQPLGFPSEGKLAAVRLTDEVFQWFNR